MDTRKPAFRWLGLNGKRDNGVTLAIPPSPKQGIKRGFGVDITNVDLTNRTKSASSGDKKPVKVQIRNGDLKECNLAAQKQMHGSKGYVFGPFSPLGMVIRAQNDDEGKGRGNVQGWESLAKSNRPEYHNQGLLHPLNFFIKKKSAKYLCWSASFLFELHQQWDGTFLCVLRQ